MLRALDQFVEHHGDGTEYDDGGDHHVELEETGSVGERDRHGEKFSWIEVVEILLKSIFAL